MSDLKRGSEPLVPQSSADRGFIERTHRGVYFSIWFGAWLLALLVQVPGMGTVDTLRRWQVTRSWGTEAPEVRPDDQKEFGVPGRDGVWHAWYGPGQSLLMLPADLLARVAERWVPQPELRPKFTSALVATLTFPPLIASSVCLFFIWLGQLGFLPLQRLVGAFSLLLTSSFLYYSQVHMENSLQVFLLALDAVCLGRWMTTERGRWLAGAAGTVAFAVNIRVPALAEHGGLWLAMLVVQYYRSYQTTPGAGLGWRSWRWGQLFRVAWPFVTLGFIADRVYQWHRFGTWSGTYISEFARHQRTKNLLLPAHYPFDGNFWDGFLGPLISPARGVLWSDPMVILLLLLTVVCWRQFCRPIRATLVGLGLGFFSLLLFYAKVSFWNGSTTWGNRYTLTPIHALVVLVLPLWLRHVNPGRWWTRHVLPTILLAAMAVQVTSILLPSAVEDQLPAATVGPLIPLARVANVFSVVSGELPPPGVNREDWRLNLVPATLGAVVPRLKPWLWGAWFVGLSGTVWTLYGAYRKVNEWDATIDGYEDDRTPDWWPELRNPDNDKRLS